MKRVDIEYLSYPDDLVPNTYFEKDLKKVMKKFGLKETGSGYNVRSKVRDLTYECSPEK